MSIRVGGVGGLVLGVSLMTAAVASAQGDPAKPAANASGQSPSGGNPPAQAPGREFIFDLGEIVVVGSQEGTPGVGGSVLSRQEMWTFDRNALPEAVNMVPGVVSTLDANGRRNESDIFVRGFGRWQVPLTLDGVRIYLPADNRLDFGRFLTADIAAVQIQKGYASVLDGPGAMGGAINLVTRKPTKAIEAEASAELGGRSGREGWTGYAMAGTRRERYYAQGSVNFADRDFSTLSGDYRRPANSLQPDGRRLTSDAQDSRLNLKAGLTPNDRDEYTINYTKQWGEKGAPLNIYNNPPVPPNSFWRWPYWDVQNTSFLSKTQLGASSYVKTKLYYNVFENAVDAFDDITYTTQSANGRFRSPYDDHAYGASVEAGTTPNTTNTIKAAVHYRNDFHSEQNFNRPTHPTLSTTEPLQKQSQYTWSLALEDTWHATASVDIVGGVSYESYAITKAEEFNATRGLFEYPKGGSESFNWQSAVIWHYNAAGQLHASVSDRARFPVIFELYSTRFGTATPNPDLGPERATNLELGWKTSTTNNIEIAGAVFYSDVRDLIQTVQLPDTTTQTQNVGNGHFGGAEISINAPVGDQLRVGGNYTGISRTIKDALQPSLRPTGVPTHKAFLFANWQPMRKLSIVPSLDIASDRWSDMATSPVAAFPYVQTGAYTLVNLSAQYDVATNFAVVFGFKNVNDQNYELAWGLPQPGRTFYFKTRIGY